MGLSLAFGQVNRREVTMLDRMVRDEWVDRFGYTYRLKDICDSHLQAIISMLNRMADTLKDEIDDKLVADDNRVLTQAEVQERKRIWSLSPLEWLKEQPMYRRLLAEATTRGLAIYH